MERAKSGLKGLLIILVAMTFVVGFSAQALGQSTYGALIGTVTDASGSVIPNAGVEARNQATDVTRAAHTDSQGDYAFVDMDPGTYTITVSGQGFATEKNEGVILPARETVRSDFKLQVQSVSQQIVVTSHQEVVSEDLTLSSSMSGGEINSLPLNFRATNAPSPIDVATLTAGVNEDPGGNLTFAGQLPTATSFTLDGISTQLVRYGGPTKDLFPSVEGISEFRVNTAGNSAEYAQPTDLTVITKSGSNQFHGGAFGFFQRKSWNAMDGVANYNPSLNANTFGGSIGGPIIKDHTFFYFDYEGVRLNYNTLIATETIPTAWAGGDFSGVPGLVLTNPLTGQVFQNNQIPVNPTAAKILPLFFPTPNNSSTNIDVTGNNLVTTFPGTYSENGYDGRIDQVFNANHRIFFRITQKNPTNTGTDPTAAIGALGTSSDSAYNPLMGTFSTTLDSTNLAVAYSWVIRPDLLNELRGGWTRANFSYLYPQAAQGNSIISQLGITGLPGPPKNGLGGVPVFYVGNLMGGATNQFGHPRVEGNGIFELGDNLTWMRGRFTSKFGFDFRRLNYSDQITFLNGDEYGDYFFSGAYTCLGAGETAQFPDACSVAELLQGDIDYAAQAQNGPSGRPYGYHYSGFGQTEWKVRRDFTLTAGLRYEVNVPFQDATNQLGNFEYQIPGGALVVNPGEAISPAWKEAVGDTPFVLASSVGLGPALRYTYWDNIQPRLGLAWMPSSNNVVRASAGIYSVPVLGAVLYSLLGVDTSNYGSYYPTEATPILNFSNVFAGTPGVSSFPGYRRANQWNLKDPRVYQWNGVYERNIGFQTLLRLGYTGSHAVDLIYSPDMNQVQPNTASYTYPTGQTVYGYAALTATPALRQQNLKYPNFFEVLTRNNGPSDKYESFMIELNKRFGHGLSFTNSYTLAWNKTNALGVAPNSAIGTGGQGDNGANVDNIYNNAVDTGNAYFDPRNAFISTFVYELPFGRGKTYLGNSSRAADLVVGGWSLTGNAFLRSGFWETPFYKSSTYDSSGTDPSERSVKQQRPDCASGISGYFSNPTTAAFFNVAPYSIPAHPTDAAGTAEPIGRFGDCGVGILEGPGTATFSMSAGKTFRLSERLALRYEAEFSNLFNLVNWGEPNMNITSTFGRISSEQGNAQAGPRNIQMQIRFLF